MRLTPEDVAALEAERAQHPDDAAIAFRLAKAYYGTDRFIDARRTLGAVLEREPDNAEARAYLGFTYDALERFDSARAVYTGLIASKPNSEMARVLTGRLAILTRRELHAEARNALAQEAVLAQTTPDPGTVAVLPFRYTGSDSTLLPLERGLAALVVTDLSRVKSLRLVERERLQALMDELQLAASGRVDPGTGARSGKLVGAGQVVQGQYQDVPTGSVRLDAAVVRAGDAQIAASGTATDRLQALFDAEKSVVFQLLNRMGVTLTPAESVAVSERPTRDLQAFLLYSSGLEAQDRGDFGAAAVSFRGAAARDPSFQAAGQQAQQASDAQAATQTTETQVATLAGGGGEGGGGGTEGAQTLTTLINTTVPTGAGIVATTPSSVEITLPPTNPNPVCEATGCGVTELLRGSIIIIIRRP